MDDEQPKQPSPPEPPTPPTYTPRPGVLIVALLLVVLMFFNVWLDAASKDYNGLYVTGICAALIAGALGFDMKFWKGGGL